MTILPSSVRRFCASKKASLKRVLPQRVMTLYSPTIIVPNSLLCQNTDPHYLIQIRTQSLFPKQILQHRVRIAAHSAAALLHLILAANRAAVEIENASKSRFCAVFHTIICIFHHNHCIPFHVLLLS